MKNRQSQPPITRTAVLLATTQAYSGYYPAIVSETGAEYYVDKKYSVGFTSKRERMTEDYPPGSVVVIDPTDRFVCCEFENCGGNTSDDNHTPGGFYAMWRIWELVKEEDCGEVQTTQF